jgi:hypothetical protein
VTTSRPQLRILGWTAATLLLAVGLSCANVLGPERDVVIALADLLVPSAVASAGPLEGTAIVQLGGCLTFRRLAISRAGSIIHITAQGRDGSGPAVLCPADIRNVSYPFRVDGGFSGALTIQGHQPDGTTLIRTVSVR